MDGIAIRVPGATYDHRSFVDWALYDPGISPPSLIAKGSLNEFDTTASEKWAVFFPPVKASRDKTFRLTLDIQPGRKAAWSELLSQARLAGVSYRDPDIPDFRMTLLAGGCYAQPESAR